MATDDALDLDLGEEIEAALDGNSDEIDIDDLNIDLSGGGDDGGQHAGGGDIDDHEDSAASRAGSSNAEYMQRRKQEETNAKVSRDSWEAELAKREAALKAAQEKYKAIRRDVDSDEDAEIAAQQEVIDAGYSANQARDNFNAADRFNEEIAARPKLAPAAQSWLDANAARYGRDKDFTERARKVMAELKDEGLDERHQNFYRKLDAKMRTTPKMRGNQNTARTGVRRAGNAGRTDQGGKDDLTPTESTFITRMGYNPKEKRVRDEWVRNRKQVERQVLGE